MHGPLPVKRWVGPHVEKRRKVKTARNNSDRWRSPGWSASLPATSGKAPKKRKRKARR